MKIDRKTLDGRSGRDRYAMNMYCHEGDRRTYIDPLDVEPISSMWAHCINHYDGLGMINCEVDAYLCVYAVVDIRAGEQLLIDYRDGKDEMYKDIRRKGGE